MIQVKAHTYSGNFSDREVDSELVFVSSQLVTHLTKKPAIKGQFITRFMGDASGAHHLGRADDARRLLQASCDTAGAMFLAISAPPNTTVTFNCNGALVSGHSGPPGFYCGPAPWISTVFVAAVLGRRDTIDALSTVPVTVLERAPGERDQCFAHLANAVQAFFADEDLGNPLAEFRRLSEPDLLKVATPSLLARFRGLGAALLAVTERDQGGFTAALVATLEGHRAAFGTGQEGKSHAYLIDYLSSGLAVLARARGLSVEVESPYMPKWLIFN
jgi:Immunity protein 49